VEGAVKHLKLCQCPTCVERRFDSFVDAVQSFRKETGAAPNSPDQTVRVAEYKVRAHFRRNPRHMNADPELRARVEEYFARLAAKKKSGG
jgi:hypothetical protein